MKSGITKLLTGLSLVSVSFLGAVPAGASPVVAPFTNGNFANGNYVDNGWGLDTLPGGSTNISGWTVGGDSVDWINTWWTVSDGRSIDLNGNKPGSISQTFATVSGATYDVSFSYAGNFDNFLYDMGLFTTIYTRNGTVQATDNAPQTFTATDLFVNNKSTWSHTNMGWASTTYQFTATSDTTTLTFTGDPNTGGYGPVIADVSVSSELLASSGAQCKGGGWKIYSNPTTSFPFMNQGQCVSYFATLGDTPIGSSNSSWLNN